MKELMIRVDIIDDGMVHRNQYMVSPLDWEKMAPVTPPMLGDVLGMTDWHMRREYRDKFTTMLSAQIALAMVDYFVNEHSKLKEGGIGRFG